MQRKCWLLIALLVLAIPGSAQDKVPGATWKYEMSPVSGKSGARKGAFRIHGEKIFQPRDGKPTEIGRIVGKKVDTERPSKGERVRVEFEALGGSDGKTLKVSGPVMFKERGEVSGRLIDADGAHWNFEASRFQE